MSAGPLHPLASLRGRRRARSASKPSSGPVPSSPPTRAARMHTFYPNMKASHSLPSLLHTKLPTLGGTHRSPYHTRRMASTESAIDPESGIPLYMMPTKRSRGRRPVISPELDLAPDIEHTTASNQAQVQFSGVTKTGKPRKIFVCRVPECDKCFRRAEHLKRHVRSLHTNHKRKTVNNCSANPALADRMKTLLHQPTPAVILDAASRSPEETI